MEQPPDVEEDDCLPDYRYLFRPDLLQGKVAFITGGGSGIGFRITEIFMRHGCQTVIVSRSLPRVLMAAKKLAAATGQCCLPISMDVRDTPAIMAAVDQALKKFGKIDILINCAAGNFLCPASALSFNAFKTVVEIDTIGTFNVTRVLYEKFFQDHGGVIVNITATLSLRGQVLQVHAGSAKAAVGMVPLVCPRGFPVAPSADCFGGWQASHEPESTCGPQRGMALALSRHRTSHPRQSGFAYFPSFHADAMTRHLAVEWGPQNIRVNSLAPGPISGTEGLRRLGGIEASLSKELPHSPLQRMGNKTEIAHSALYLASPLASYVTGIMLVVDGGCWLTHPNDIKKLATLESTSAKL